MEFGYRFPNSGIMNKIDALGAVYVNATTADNLSNWNSVTERLILSFSITGFQASRRILSEILYTFMTLPFFWALLMPKRLTWSIAEMESSLNFYKNSPIVRCRPSQNQTHSEKKPSICKIFLNSSIEKNLKTFEEDVIICRSWFTRIQVLQFRGSQKLPVLIT